MLQSILLSEDVIILARYISFLSGLGTRQAQKGQIIQREGSGEDLKLTVIFRGGLKKKLLAKYADLEIVGH
jgi:hypothetical protein